MFNVVMDLLVVFIMYSGYYLVKKKMVAYVDGSMDFDREVWILGIFLFCFLFYSPTEMVYWTHFNIRNLDLMPFSRVIDTYKNEAFYQYVKGSSDFANEFNWVILDHFRTLLSLAPLVLASRFLWKSWWKGWLVSLVIGTLVYTSAGYDELVTIMILISVAYVIAMLMTKTIKALFGDNEKGLLYGQRILLGVFILGNLFLVIKGANEIEFTNRQQREEVSFKQDIEMFDGAFKWHIDRKNLVYDEIELIGKTDDQIMERIPYEIDQKIVDFTVVTNGYKRTIKAYFTGDEDMSLRFSGQRYVNGKWTDDDLYPIEIYGISEINYVTKSESFYQQLESLEEGWLESEPYAVYRYVYAMPAVEGFTGQVFYQENIVDKKGSDEVYYTTKEGLLSTTDTQFIMEVLIYFRDHKAEDIKTMTREPRSGRYSIKEALSEIPLMTLYGED